MLSQYLWVRSIIANARLDPFADVEFKQARFDQIMALPQPEQRYVIFFTPRSGSSRLTDLAEKTKGLGEPGECFNPAFVPKIAQAYSARSMQEYMDLLTRVRGTSGIFGSEATFIHVIRTFRTGKRFLQMTQPDTTLWLVREDIIAQAVSISRMSQTKVAHSPHSNQDDVAKADKGFEYKPKSIRNILNRLRWMEIGTERLIKRYDLTPLRLTYEQCVAVPEQDLVQGIAAHVGVPSHQIDISELKSDHKKLAGDKSKVFIDRFREEHPDIIEQLKRDRAAMLDAHAASKLT